MLMPMLSLPRTEFWVDYWSNPYASSGERDLIISGLTDITFAVPVSFGLCSEVAIPDVSRVS